MFKLVKLQESKNRFFLTIPKQFVKLSGWKAGQELVVYPVGEKQLAIREMPEQKGE